MLTGDVLCLAARTPPSLTNMTNMIAQACGLGFGLHTFTKMADKTFEQENALGSSPQNLYNNGCRIITRNRTNYRAHYLN